MSSLFTTSDYQSALLAHLPRGRVWQTGPDNPLTKLSQALATSFQRVDASAMSLLTGGFPATALELLPEWEESLGLPDNCTIGETYTIERRRQTVNLPMVMWLVG